MATCSVCLACLKTSRLCDLRSSDLLHSYETILGYKLEGNGVLPTVLCFLCAALLRKYTKFQRQCKEAHRLLTSSYDDYRLTWECDKSSFETSVSLSYSSPTIHDSTVPEVIQIEIQSFNHFDSDNFYDSDEDKPLAYTKQLIKQESELVIEKKKKRKDKKTKKKKIEVKPAEQKKKKEGELSVKDVQNFATLRVLTHEEQVAEVEKRKETTNYRNSPYKCDLCYKGFVDTNTHKNHMQRHSSASGPFECGVCHIRRSTAHRLRGHVTAVHSRRYVCASCRHVSTNANQALEHEKWHRGVVHQCQFCEKSFSKWSSRLSHERLRHRSQFVCSICGDAFVSALGLAQHASRAHAQTAAAPPPEGAYCAECDVHFSTHEAFTRHTLTSDKHGHDAMSGCRRCGVVFNTEAAWAEHAASHAARCGRVRRRGYVLPRHGRTACQQCGEEFTAASHCMSHYKSRHPGVKYPAEFVCETCGTKCKNRAVLLYHQRTHTGERPYPCNVCGAAFKHQSNLRRHSRVHTGEKLFECELCGKRFTQKVGKDMHVRTVHEKQPYPRRNRAVRDHQSSVLLRMTD